MLWMLTHRLLLEAASNPAGGAGDVLLGGAGTTTTTCLVGKGPTARGSRQMGFEPAGGFLQRPRSSPRSCGDLQVEHACRDRLCPPSTRGRRWDSDPARTIGLLVSSGCGRPGAWSSVTKDRIGRRARPRPILALHGELGKHPRTALDRLIL